FAERFARRNLQQLRRRRVLDFGQILYRCLLLRERRSGAECQGKDSCEHGTTLHWTLPITRINAFFWTESAASISNEFSRDAFEELIDDEPGRAADHALADARNGTA